MAVRKRSVDSVTGGFVAIAAVAAAATVTATAAAIVGIGACRLGGQRDGGTGIGLRTGVRRHGFDDGGVIGWSADRYLEARAFQLALRLGEGEAGHVRHAHLLFAQRHPDRYG